MRFLPAEKLLLWIIGVLLAADIVLIASSGTRIDITGYTVMFGAGMLVVAAGQVYRYRGRDEKIALATAAAGLFVIYSNAAAAFNYLIIPFAGARIDTALMAVDAALGFHWSSFVEAMAHYPRFATLLGYVYMSSIPQLVILILILGFTGDRARLHRFLLTGVFGSLLAIAFWLFAPSSGPAAYQTISAETLSRIPMVVGNGYGEELNRLFSEGVTRLSPSDALGLIAFPSFHTVMAVMAVWFVPRRLLLRPLVWGLNMLMLPAILLHGGHHLVDIGGGFAAFAIALVLANRVCALLEREPAVSAGTRTVRA